MVGHKYTLSELLVDLKTEGIKHTHTEFCQGRVTRWGLAWTYQDYDIYHLVPPREKLRKKTLPILHHLPPIPNSEYNLESSYGKLKTILNGLQIEQKVLNKCGNRISLDILARENTWSNQRRKRRLLKQMETSDAKRSKSESNNIEPNVSNIEKLNEENGTKSNIGVKNEAIAATSLTSQVDDIKSHQNNQEKDGSNKDTVENGSTNVDIIRNNFKDSSLGNIGLDNKSQHSTEPLIHAFMKLYKKDDKVQLEIEVVGGNGGKESVYQVIQYIKNNWK